MRLRKLDWFAIVVALAALTIAGIYGYRKIHGLQFVIALLWLVLGALGARRHRPSA
jgi:hypothetical protein